MKTIKFFIWGALLSIIIPSSIAMWLMVPLLGLCFSLFCFFALGIIWLLLKELS